jgi:RND family efflux transporter MFP subunit
MAGVRRTLRLPSLILAGLSLACRGDRPAAEQAAARPPLLPAPRVAQAAPAAPADKGWIGVVVAAESVEVAAESPGRLLAIEVGIGDEVRAGQRLAVLDTRALAQEMEMARSALTAAEAEARRATDEAAEAEARQARRGQSPELFSAEDLAEVALRAKTARATLDVARARVAEHQARLRQLEANAAKSEVRAPFAGRVAERFVDAGALVGPGTAVVRLISAGEVLIRAAVPPQEAKTLAVGDAVVARVRTLGTRAEGTIARIAPELDAASQMVFIEARLAPGAAGAIPAGAVVEVRPKAPRTGAVG